MRARWYQSEAVDAVYDYFARGNTGNPLVALPTGTGKSFVQALLVQTILSKWPRQRFICLTHVQELIENNVADLLEAWPTAPVGVYSAGLGIKQAHAPIIYGGIQSVVNNIEALGHRDLMFVDECHLMNGKDDSLYGKVIAALRARNPWLKIIGFTATPYRTGAGLLTDGAVFTDIVYDLTTMSQFNRLIDEGWLCPIKTPSSRVEIDVSNVESRNGEYNLTQLQDAADVKSITDAAVYEACEYGRNRRSWLFFASGVKHATHISERLTSWGVPNGVVTGDTSKDVRKQLVTDYKDFRLRALVNFGVFTTGFNHKAVDLIANLRPTKSVGLHVQMWGRGTRPYPGKEYCLGLDFAGNTKRLGPINDPVIPQKRGKGTPGVVPIKVCPECGFYNHSRAALCCNCAYVFPQHENINPTAATDELLRFETPSVEVFDVMYTFYNSAQKGTNPPYLRVSYHCGAMGMQRFDENVMLEHPGHSSHEGRAWWRQRYLGDGTARRPASFTGYVPSTVAEALTIHQYLKQPRQIRVHLNNVVKGKTYPTVIGYTWN